MPRRRLSGVRPKSSHAPERKVGWRLAPGGRLSGLEETALPNRSSAAQKRCLEPYTLCKNLGLGVRRQLSIRRSLPPPCRGGHAVGSQLSLAQPGPSGTGGNGRVKTGQSAPRRGGRLRRSKTGQSAPRRRRRQRPVQAGQKQQRKRTSRQGRVKDPGQPGRSSFRPIRNGPREEQLGFQTTHFPGRF
jgi:hypothetical protein